MNVDWIIACRHVEIHDNLGSLMGAGIDTFWLPELPNPIQVAIAVRLTALPEELEAGGEHTARTIVRGPGGEAVSEITGTFSVGGRGADDRRDWVQGIMVGAVVQFMAETEGAYALEHVVDGSSASIPLHVVQSSPSA